MTHARYSAREYRNTKIICIGDCVSTRRRGNRGFAVGALSGHPPSISFGLISFDRDPS